MEWVRVVTGQSLLSGLSAWLVPALLLLLLVILAALETFWPLYREPKTSERRLVANFGLGILNALLLAAVPVSAVIAADWARTRGFGLLNMAPLPPVVAAVGTVLAWSLAIYALHILAHRVPLLWRVHRVHHSDTAIDLSTGVRHHPFELAYATLLMSGVAVLLGLSPAAITLYAATAAAIALITHANIRLPERLDRALRLALTTPAAHHVHHSSERTETDCNYAEIFLFWDRLFGTYRDRSHDDLIRARPGLGDAHDIGADKFLVQLRAPLNDPRPDAARSTP